MTGRARARIANEKGTIAVGSFKARSEDSGVFKFEIPWKVTSYQSSLETIFEFKGSNDLVEFVDGGGHTVALITVGPNDIRPIKAGELLHARTTA